MHAHATDFRALGLPVELEAAHRAAVCGLTPENPIEVDTDHLHDRGYSVHFGDDSYHGDPLHGRWWWCLYRDGWSEVESGEGSFATEDEAWADAARADATDADTFWQAVLDALQVATGGNAPDDDDRGMSEACDDDLRLWVEDLQDRLGFDMVDVRPAVEAYIASRDGECYSAACAAADVADGATP
jgi:hypothetical protein